MSAAAVTSAGAGVVSLRDAWELRNAAAATLIKAEQQVRQLLETSDAAGIVSLLETFSPARSSGPEWTRSLDPLSERLWAWCDAATLRAVEAEFGSRGPAWSAVTNMLAPARGEELRAQLRHSSAVAQLPSFTLA
jgi:hypothetical protein